MGTPADEGIIDNGDCDVSHRGRYAATSQDELMTGQDRFLGLAQSAQAELVNQRKRADRENKKAHHRALAEVLKALTPAIAKTELALRAAEAEGRDIENDPLLRCVVASQHELLTQLGKLGASIIGAVGEKFDPERHEAITVDPAAPEGIISEVLSPGYAAGDHTIVAAQVAVGSA
jgi:molecular chaperone GrpE